MFARLMTFLASEMSGMVSSRSRAEGLYGKRSVEAVLNSIGQLARAPDT